MARHLRALFFVGALLASAHLVDAAPGTTDSLDDFWITHWEDTGGAKSELVIAMAQDRDGFLWLGSSDGLTRFDGFTFERWSASDSPLAGSDVRTLFVDRDGALWVGFDAGGVSRIVGRRVRNYSLPDGLPAASVRALVQDNEGSIWAGTLAGLFKLTNERWLEQAVGTTPHTAVLSALYDSTGSLFVGTPDAVMRRRSGSTTFEIFDEHSLGATNTQSLCKDGDGHIVATDPISGLRILDDSAVHHLPPTAGVGLKALCTRNGTIWVGTRLTGLWRIGPVTAPSATIPVETSLISQAALAILLDRDQNLWVASNAGLYRLTPRNVRTLRDAGAPTAVMSDASGRMWVGTTAGLSLFVRQGPEWRRTASYLPGSTIRSIHVDSRGVVWVASTDGVIRIARDGAAIASPWGRTLRQVASITSSPDGTAWIYDQQLGLHNVRDNVSTHVELRPDLLGEARTVLHFDRRNRLWIVNDGGVEVHGKDGDVRRYTTADGLDAALYRSIFEDRDGTIWLGSSAGISRLVGARIESVRVPGARRSSWVKTIVEDRQGELWLGLDRGGVRFTRASFQNALHSPSRTMTDGFEVFDGLPGTIRALSDRVGVRTPDDQLWFTTDEGLAAVDPDAELPDLGIVPARITAAATDDSRLNTFQPGQLSAGASRLHMSWAALDLTTPERVRFRYRLDGIDRDWKDAGTTREVEYANLGAGTYVFRVAATREGNAWSDASDSSWEFTIAPHVYQTVWFPFVATALLASASWAMWHMRMVQTRRRFAITLTERARVSREVHDTLLQSLVGVALQCQALAESGDNPGMRDRLVQLRKRIDEHIEEGRELIWNLRSPTLEKYDLVSALRRMADDIVTGTDVRIEFTITGKARSCSPRAERELLRIGQEAITNAVRHGKPSVVTVELAFEERAIRLHVTDDGCGFSSSQTMDTADRHCGLVMMRERAEDIGGRCTILSTPGHGTRVDAMAPLVPGKP